MIALRKLRGRAQSVRAGDTESLHRLIAAAFRIRHADGDEVRLAVHLNDSGPGFAQQIIGLSNDGIERRNER